jgi:N-acetylglucosaminyldiphosphoundecaprenol N-acetyl-beta-D-mannosaminyltransferase
MTTVLYNADFQSTPSLHNAAWILGVKVHIVTMEQVIAVIEHSVLTDARVIIANVNVHALNLAFDLPWFRDFLNHSKLVFCDGFGIKWAACLLGQHIPHRFTPPDWIATLAETAASHGFTLFFLGGHPGVAEQAACKLRQQVPDLRVAGTHDGYFDKTRGGSENEKVIEKINAVRPDILVVGFGMPLQERWLIENWERIEVKVALPVGALFDYVSGRIRRAPKWATDHSLEWLGRLMIEPRRLWKRYLIGNPLFLYRVIKQRLGLLTLD